MSIVTVSLSNKPEMCCYHTFLNLATLVKSTRRQRGVSRGQLANLIGYRNISKGARRIDAFERGDSFDDQLIARMATALVIPRDVCELAWLTDWSRLHHQWTDWIDEVIPHRIIVGTDTTRYREIVLQCQIPDLRTAERFSARIARQFQRPVWLIFSRRVASQLDRHGRVIRRVEALPPQIGEAFFELGGFIVPGGTHAPQIAPSKLRRRFAVTDRYGAVTYTNK